MKKNDNGSYVPGVIYELGVYLDDVWYAFYVGETTNADKRLAEHISSAKNDKELLVYDYMRKLTALGTTTHMILVDSYGSEGPADLEDEHIMRNLLNDVKLQNMKKGSVGWMTNMLSVKEKMRSNGFKSLRKYKVWDAEQTRIANDKRHAERVAKENKIPLIDRIKAQTKFTDKEKLRLMANENNERKAASILSALKR